MSVPDPQSPVSGQLSCQDVTVWRNDELIVNRVSFDLLAGQTLLITGHNGSGKTTLLRVLASLRVPDEGAVLLDGRKASEDRLHWAKQVAYCGHQNGLGDTLTVAENLSFVRTCSRTWAKRDDTNIKSLDTTIETALNHLGISHLADWTLGKLSAGQRRRVTLASLLMRDAFLWLLDEPFTAIDSDGRDLIEQVIIDHVNAGGACILTSHQDLVSSNLHNHLTQLTLERPRQHD